MCSNAGAGCMYLCCLTHVFEQAVSAVCRYKKFRKLGQFEEWVVRGADWRNTRSERTNAAGTRTDAGTWALNEAEAAYIESSVNAGG